MSFYLRVFTVILLAAVPIGSGAQARCSRETLAVRATPVTIAYCVTEASGVRTSGEVALAVAGTYSAPGGSFSHSNVMHFITGVGPSRVLENVGLAQLGLKGTLHLTLVYAGGVVRIESALLTPGAIIIK